VAIAGISLEASTFSPARTTIEMLAPQRGQQILDAREFWAPGGSLTDAALWVPILQGRGIPGGAIPAADYAVLLAEILDGLATAHAAEPLDGMVLDLHGAASVVGLDDMEGEVAAACREVVGPDVLISTGMDLHGNVSRRLAESLDLLTTYRTAPHVDWLETKERAVRNLLFQLARPESERRPYKAWAPVPILLPGEQTSTRLEPARSLYAEVPRIEAMDGVLDVGVWIGYPWADEPRNRAVVMVIGDDPEVCLTQAQWLADQVWARREEFTFVAPTGDFDTTLRAALESDARPFFVSDSGDNPTAGGAGDVTWTLARLLDSELLAASGKRAIYASIPDAEAVEAAAVAGVGARVSLSAGARVDDRHEPPVRIEGIVRAVVPTSDEGRDNLEVVIETPHVDVILTRHRRPYHEERHFTRLGLAPRAADLVYVKIGYLEPELYNMAADWLLALTPGGVDQDLLRLGHRRIEQPMYPYDTDFPAGFGPRAELIDRVGV